jgi:hypothetical protein
MGGSKGLKKALESLVMTAITQTLGSPASHLRPFDVGRDLNAVADLVETCFADTLDEDEALCPANARCRAQPRYLRWASGRRPCLDAADRVCVEENGYLAGNLSLIPSKPGAALLSDRECGSRSRYRRRGIARR